MTLSMPPAALTWATMSVGTITLSMDASVGGTGVVNAPAALLTLSGVSTLLESVPTVPASMTLSSLASAQGAARPVPASMTLSSPVTAAFSLTGRATVTLSGSAKASSQTLAVPATLTLSASAIVFLNTGAFLGDTPVATVTKSGPGATITRVPLPAGSVNGSHVSGTIVRANPVTGTTSGNSPVGVIEKT